MSDTDRTITRRRVIGTGALAALAATVAGLVAPSPPAQAAPVPPAPLPLLVVEQAAEEEIRAMLLVLRGRARLWSNTNLNDRATSERWAREQLAAGQVFALWTTDDF